MRALLLSVGLLALVASPVLASKKRESKPRIERLEASREGDRVAVSFRLANVLAEETLERIHSGIPVTHRHRVEVLARRTVPLWSAKTVTRLFVETRVAYDSLTRRYRLTRTTDFKQRKKDEPPSAEQTLSTESLDDVIVWMTTVKDLPDLELPIALREQRVRVRLESTLGRRYALFLFPARLIVSAERKLEP